MLKIAIPNKGSLSESSVQILKEAGYATRRDSRQLVVEDSANGVQFFYLRPRDIAIYVGSGTLDAGVTGLDLLLDSGARAREVTRLGFAASTFRFAAHTSGPKSLRELSGRRVATSYPKLLADFLATKGVEAEIVKLDGAVESSIELGVADAIADVVSTGTTLKQAGLQVFGDPILQSEALLISSPKLESAGESALAELQIVRRRLEGVITARKYVLLDYDIETQFLDAAVAIAPGFSGPTVSPLRGGSKTDSTPWNAVRVMVARSELNQIMDRLHDAGARAILATEILASRI